MEFVTYIDTVIHKRFFLLDFLYELSDELHLLVLLTENTLLLDFIFYDEFCLFFYNSYLNNPSAPIG